MRYLTFISCLLGLLVISIHQARADAYASLVGDTIDVTFSSTVSVEVKSPQVELIDVGPTLGAPGSSQWDIDIEPTTIRIDFDADATYQNGSSFTFGDLDPVVCGSLPGDVFYVILLDTNKPASEFDFEGMLTFSPDSVRLQIAPDVGAADWYEGQYVELLVYYDVDPDATFDDCNNNSMADVCDIILSPEKDVNHNGIIDQCEKTCIDPPSNMVSWWTLDETSGSASKDSVGDNDGFHIGDPVPVSGKVEGALNFDGMDDYVEVPSSPSLNFGMGSFSIDAWVRPLSGTSFLRVIAAKSDGNVGFVLATYNNNVVAFEMDDGSQGEIILSGGDPLPVGEWSHVAVTVDRSDPDGAKLYVNGVVVDTKDPTSHSGSIDTPASFSIGSAGGSEDTFFSGDIDEVELFDRALDFQEVIDIYEIDDLGKCREICSILGYMGGFMDDFILPVEPASPGPNFAAHGFIATRDFDEAGVDKPFGHTFSGLPPEITGAALEIYLKANGGQPYNDSIRLEIQGDGTFAWSSSLNGFADDSYWESGDIMTLRFNLASLGILDSINMDNALDVYVHDDTLVDYAILWVQYGRCGCLTPPDDMVGWWPFDRWQGSVAYDYAQGFHGEHKNSPTPVFGKVDVALNFDGINDYVQVPHHDDIAFDGYALSIDSWIRTDLATATQTIVDKRVTTYPPKGYWFYIQDDQLVFHVARHDGTFAEYVSPHDSRLVSGEWVNVAVTARLNTSPMVGEIKLYVNGSMVLAEYQDFGQAVLYHSGDLYIGASAQTASAYFYGGIDEVEIFDRALLPLEVKNIYLAGSAGKCKEFCGKTFKAYPPEHIHYMPLEGGGYDGENYDELIIGSRFADTINGKGGDDCIYGYAGNDEIHGDKMGLSFSATGQDTIYGGSGNDKLYGDGKNDTIYGDDGDDKIKGDVGDDVLYGGSGNDTIQGDDGNDTIYGGDGLDELYGLSGDDLIYGGEDKDWLQGNAGSDSLYGEEGDDTLKGDSGRDTLVGGPGKDFLKGDSGSDDLFGGEGNDKLCGNAQGDFLGGGLGNNGGRGGLGNDTLVQIGYKLKAKACTTKKGSGKKPNLHESEP